MPHCQKKNKLGGIAWALINLQEFGPSLNDIIELTDIQRAWHPKLCTEFRYESKAKGMKSRIDFFKEVRGQKFPSTVFF